MSFFKRFALESKKLHLLSPWILNFNEIVKHSKQFTNVSHISYPHCEIFYTSHSVYATGRYMIRACTPVFVLRIHIAGTDNCLLSPVHHGSYTNYISELLAGRAGTSLCFYAKVRRLLINNNIIYSKQTPPTLQKPANPLAQVVRRRAVTSKAWVRA